MFRAPSEQSPRQRQRYELNTWFGLYFELEIVTCLVLLLLGRLQANCGNWGAAAAALTEAVNILGRSLGGHPITTEGTYPA